MRVRRQANDVSRNRLHTWLTILRISLSRIGGRDDQGSKSLNASSRAGCLEICAATVPTQVSGRTHRALCSGTTAGRLPPRCKVGAKSVTRPRPSVRRCWLDVLPRSRSAGGRWLYPVGSSLGSPKVSVDVVFPTKVFPHRDWFAIPAFSGIASAECSHFAVGQNFDGRILLLVQDRLKFVDCRFPCHSGHPLWLCECTIVIIGQSQLSIKPDHRARVLSVTRRQSTRPAEIALFGALSASGRLGTGECSAIAVAVHRRHILAIDDR